MKLALRPQNAVVLFLLAALLGSGSVATSAAAGHQTCLFTAFDEGKADGKAYRASVQSDPNSPDLIAQQVQAAQSATAANPSTALYFQGYVAGLQP